MLTFAVVRITTNQLRQHMQLNELNSAVKS